MKHDPLKQIKTEHSLTKLIIHNDVCQAEIYLHGAHLTHYQVHGEKALVFDGKNSVVTPPKSVHAGIPVCWPWFGAHPTDSSKPQHGFARDRVWQLKSTETITADETKVVLKLSDDENTHTLFPYAFDLELTFTIGKKLTVSLKTTNLDKTPFNITQALHTYFALSSVQDVIITGVKDTPFVDYTDDKKEKNEHKVLEIREEVNRVYIPTSSTCTIIDKKLNRKIIIEKHGSNSTTIWNPWKESGIHDLTGNKYSHFVCIETTNALSDQKELKPKESHTIEQIISSETL